MLTRGVHIHEIYRPVLHCPKRKMEKLVLPKFNGEDFAVWRFQIESYLAVHELLGVVDGTTKRPLEANAQSEWDKLDRKARLIIGSALETNVVRQIMNLKTANEMWVRLSSLYELRDKTTVHLLLQRFFDYKMEESMTIGQHVSKIEEMARKLEDLGHKQEEVAIVTKTLHSLPSSYRYVISAWDSMPSDQQTMANLLPRLLKEEALNKSMSATSHEDNTPVALLHKKANSSKVKSKKDDTKQKPKKFKGTCYNCGKFGHRKSECRNQKSEVTIKKASSKIDDNELLMVKVGYSENIIDAWFADTGASHHMSPRREIFRNFTEINDNSVAITVGNQEVVYARGRGMVDADFFLEGYTKRQTLADVLYVPEIGRNLFGIGSSTDRGAIATFGKYEMRLKKNGNVIVKGHRPGSGLYRIKMKAIVCPEAYVASSAASVNVWHERFGHTNFRTVRELVRGDAVTGIEVKHCEAQNNDEDQQICEGCILGKLTRKSFQDSTNRAKNPGELIHFDICGPMSIDAIENSKLMVLFVDDFSGIVIVFPIRHKSEIVEKLQEVIALAESSGHKVHRIRSDNAKEFLSEAMKNVCLRNNIVHEHSTPYCPEQNGRVERQNRTIVEMARSMLAAANLPRSLWSEAVRTAAHIRNRVPLARLNGKTPIEIWTNKKPDVSHLRIFGSCAYMHIDETQRKKFDNKSREMVLVGYAPGQKAYRLWERGTKRVVIAKDVIIVESSPKQIVGLPEPIGIEDIKPNDIKLDPEENEIQRDKCSHKSVGAHQEENDSIASRTRSKTSISAIIATAEALFMEGIPETVEEAKQSPEAKQWEAAMEEEIKSLKKNETWELVELPKHRKAIQNKWIFRIKTKPDGTTVRFKARLVIKGCAQKAGVDYTETFSPVTRFESVRILLSISAANNFVIRTFDIKTAFLYGDLKETIYMIQPKNFDDGSGRVCLLRKSLYGLKQGPRQWHQKFDEALKKFKLKPTNYDPCVYSNSDGTLLLALYVDDGLAAGQSENEINELFERLKQEFEIIDSKAECYLGIEIERDLKTKKIRIHQSAYTRNVLRRFEMDESNPMATPLDAKMALRRNEDEDGKAKDAADVPYRQLIGSLMYLAVSTRPDIAFAVSNLSQFLTNPSIDHWKAAKRVLRYLQGTIGLGILFIGNCEQPNVLFAYSDSDFATCIDTRKSISGVTLILNSGSVIWSARKQGVVATSTTDAEYIAAHDASKEIVWTRGLLEEIGVTQDSPTMLYCDNAAAEKLIKNPVFHRRTKHVDIKYHYVRQIYEDGKLKIQHVASEDQLADIFTKPLARDKFLINRHRLGMA